MRSATNCSSWAIEKRTLRPMRTGVSCSFQMSWYTDDLLIARIFGIGKWSWGESNPRGLVLSCVGLSQYVLVVGHFRLSSASLRAVQYRPVAAVP